MSYFEHTKCVKCGEEFLWRIERPGDRYWDRWKSDNGETLSCWFLGHNVCWDHAFEEMPERFARIIRTIEYEEPGGETPQ